MEYRDYAFVSNNVQVNILTIFDKRKKLKKLTNCNAIFRDISLEKEDHATVITIFCTRLQSIPLEEVPPFVHQSLRLCTNQDNKHLLEALRRYFTLQFAQANSDDKDSIETISKKISVVI